MVVVVRRARIVVCERARETESEPAHSQIGFASQAVRQCSIGVHLLRSVAREREKRRPGGGDFSLVVVCAIVK